MAAGASAAAAAIAQAIKASGVLVRLDPSEFLKLLRRADNPLVVLAERGWFARYQYLFSYKGLTFYAKSKVPLELAKCEIVIAGRIWLPR